MKIQTVEGIVLTETNYSESSKILNVLNTNMFTNYGRKEILSTLTLLPKLTDLQINSAIIEGEDVLTYVPKYDEDLWITLLDEQSIELNKNAIQDILKGVE